MKNNSLLSDEGALEENSEGRGLLSPISASFPVRMMIRDSDTIHVLKVRDIEWIDACGNYVEIHSRGRTYLHRGSMTGISGRLSPETFVRLHRSAIVNRDKVREIRTVAKGKYSLVMSSGDELPTRRPFNEVREMIVRT